MKLSNPFRQRVVKHSLSRRCAAVILRYSRRLARVLNHWAAGYSRARQYWALILACLSISGYCLYLILSSIFNI